MPRWSRAIPAQGGGAAPGWFSTSGNQIVDSAGHSVQIAGVNWFGFESSNLAPHGLWTRGYQDMMDQMKDLGFNTIRLPFSNDTIHSSGTPNGIDFSKNPDLQGLTAMQIMDKIVAYAGEIGLKIILDHHRNDSGPGASSNGLWYDAQHPESQWISDWQMLAGRYANNPTVIGADLHNEPHDGTWGGGGADRLGGGGRARRQRHRLGQSQLADLRRGRRQLSGPALLVGRQPDGRARPADRPQPRQQAGLLGARLPQLGVGPAVVPGQRLPGEPAGQVRPDVGLHLQGGDRAGVHRRVRHQPHRPQGRAVARGHHLLPGGRPRQQRHDRHRGRRQGRELDLLVVEPQLGRHRRHPGQRLAHG